MMAEYIEREYLLYKFIEIMPEMGVDELADEIYDIALNVEAADVVPAKHGKWIFDAENYEWNCSECHNWPIDSGLNILVLIISNVVIVNIRFRIEKRF